MTILAPTVESPPPDQELTLAIEIEGGQRGLVTITDVLSSRCIALGTLVVADAETVMSVPCAACDEVGVLVLPVDADETHEVVCDSCGGHGTVNPARVLHLAAAGLAGLLDCVVAGTWGLSNGRFSVRLAGTI